MDDLPRDSRAGCVSEKVIELESVSVSYWRGKSEVHALLEASISIARGSLIAIMGPSGSGKSTLLRVAGGLVTPSAGSVTVVERRLGDLDRTELALMRRRHVGYVFQDYNLMSSLSIAENVGLPLALDGVGGRELSAAVEIALGEVGLGDLGRALPEQLSGGQRQRVAIARAMIGTRTAILADEPTGALDTESGRIVMGAIRAACDRGAAGIVVTHDVEVARWADRCIRMRDGRLLAAEPVRDRDLDEPYGP